MMTAYRETHLETIDAAAWNALARDSGVHTVYQTYEWHKGLWTVYQKNYQLYLICVKDGDRLVGVAPLMRKDVDGVRTLFFIGHDRADYSDFLYRNGDQHVLEAIFEFLHSDSARWDKMELLNIPERSPSGPILASLTAIHHWTLRSDQCADCSAWTAPSPVDMREVVEKKSVRRHHKHYTNLPDYEVRHLTGRSDILPLLDAYFQQHIERRYVTGTPSIFLDPFVRDTYRSLVDALEGTGWLILTVVRSQGRVIAFHFGFCCDGTFIWYKPSFDIAEFRNSPGEVLLKELFEYAASAGCTTFDFTTGHEPFKERFSNTSSRNFVYEIYRDPRGAPKTETSSGTLERLWRRAGTIIRKQGLLPGLCQIARIFLEKSFEAECVHMYHLPADAKPPAAVKPDLEEFVWRQADVKDLLRLDYFKTMDKKLEYFQAAFKRLSQGDQFWIVEYGGQIVSFAWCAVRASTLIGEIDTEVRWETPALVIYDCRTLAGYQKKNLYKYMLTRLIDEHPGVEKIIYCKRDNLPSRKGIEAIFRLRKRMNYLRIFRLKLRW